MNTRLSGALLLLSSLSWIADTALNASPAQAAAPPISAAQQEMIFPEQKQLVLRDQQDRLQSIEAAQRCVKAATRSPELMGCLVEEHQQSQRISAEHHAAMLAILHRHGVHTPQASGGSKP